MSFGRPLRRPRRGDRQLSAGELGRAFGQLEDLMYGFGGNSGVIADTGFQAYDGSAPEMWIQITGGTNPYTWVQVVWSPLVGAFVPLGESDVNTQAGAVPAFEVNKVATVAAGTNARAWPDVAGMQVEFVAPGGGTAAAPAGAKARMTYTGVAQQIGNNTNLIFDTLDYDTAGLVDLPNSRFVIKTAGQYLVVGSWFGSTIDASIARRGMSIFVNGDLYATAINVPMTRVGGFNQQAIAEGSVTVTDTANLAVGDKVTFAADYTAGGPTIPTSLNAGLRPRASIVQL